MSTLRYRTSVDVEDLALNECTIRHATNAAGARWCMLWFYVARETDGKPEFFAVPVAPNGGYTENGAGGRTWGLTRVAAGTWQVSPSINVLDDGDATKHPGEHPQHRSLWHQTPALVEVPDGEAWIGGPP